MPDLHDIDELDITRSSWTLIVEKEVSLLSITNESDNSDSSLRQLSDLWHPQNSTEVER